MSATNQANRLNAQLLIAILNPFTVPQVGESEEKISEESNHKTQYHL